MVMEEQECDVGLASECVPVPHCTQARDPRDSRDSREPRNSSNTSNSLQRPCEEMLNQEVNVSRGKPRLRKKALHALILKQMEFYFSDANLSKDRFLGALIKSNPQVDLDVFLHFNKIRVLTDDVDRLAKALKSSTILSLSEDGTKVCRVTPINPRDNCEACTVYVQALPSDANHEWLSNLFSRYGPIAYVSIPRYKSNKKIKGFAFVEFDTVDGANRCLDAFREKNCTLPSHTAPHELASITTFTDDNPPSENTNSISEVTNVAQKRKNRDNIEDEGEPRVKKVCGGGANEDEKQEEEDDEEEEEEEEKNDRVDVGAANDENEEKEDDEKKDKKKKRKRKRRSRTEREDVTDLGLQIMAKRDWKQLRNKYLQLQRNKMKQLKQHLRKARWNQWNHDRRMETEHVTEKVVEPPPPPSGTTKFSFTPGVIVKIELDEPCSNPKSFKMELRSDTSVKYIDVYEGSNEAFVRCDSAESAKTFASKYSEKKNLCILDGIEEKTYWNKIEQDREEKLGKKDRVKQRGRDKLLKKAEKELGKHIKFDEV